MRLELKTIFRDKKQLVINLLLISICFGMMYIVSMGYGFIKNYISKVIENKSENTIILVNSNINQKNFKKLITNFDKKIEYYYPEYNEFYIEEYNLNLYLLNSNLINKELKDNEIVISKLFAEKYNIKKHNIILLPNKQSVEVIDILNNNDFSTVYANQDLINYIAKSLNVGIKDYIIKARKYTSANEIIEKLNEANINASLKDMNGLKELEMYESFSKVIKKLMILIYITIIIVLYFTIKKIYMYDKKNIAVKKIVGYTNKKNIIELIVKIIVYISLVTLIMFIVLLLISLFIHKLLTNTDILLALPASDLFKNYIMNLIIFVCLVIFSLLLNTRMIIKLNPVTELNNE